VVNMRELVMSLICLALVGAVALTIVWRA